MDIKLNMQCAGRYRLCTLTEDSVITKDTGWFDNLILDQGLDQIGEVNNVGVSYGEPLLFVTASVGTGSTAPAVTDTQMEAWLASANNENGYNTSYVAAVGGNPAYWVCTHTVRFGVGIAAGNLTEVGVGEKSASNIGQLLFSRALIVDGGGSPTTLTVLSTEILDLTYEYRVYIDQTAIPFSQTINGTLYTGNWLPDNISSPRTIYRAYKSSGGDFNSCSLGIASNTNGSGATAGVVPTSTGYSLGSYQRTYSGTFGLSTGNYAGGLKYIHIVTLHMNIFINTSPFIVKNSAQSFSVTFTVSWMRFTP